MKFFVGIPDIMTIENHIDTDYPLIFPMDLISHEINWLNRHKLRNDIPLSGDITQFYCGFICQSC